MSFSWHDWPSLIVLLMVGAIASGINAVAGGGSLISFPTLTGVHLFGVHVGYSLPMKEANATNSVGLWPGSLTGALGFGNLFHKTAHYMRCLWFPTLLGSLVGAWLLIATRENVFKEIVPALILLATILLAFQPQIKAWATKREAKISDWNAMILQFLVAAYGGYFGAGMGIMMLAVFTIYMEGNIHEINAVKGWLAVIINVVCSIVFIVKGLVVLVLGAAIALGAIIGGYFAARVSQRVDPNRLRLAIAGYGLLTAAYFAYHNWL